MSEIEHITKSLTKAQKTSVLSAVYVEKDGVWHPEGWYARGDKRVRYALCRLGLTRDYLRRSNNLTPLGLAVRSHLKGAA